MAVLDQVRQMKNKGLSEQEISNKLMEQGIAPKAITDAFSQAKIKDAVEGEERIMSPETFEPGVPPPQQTAPGTYAPAAQEMPAGEAAMPTEEYYPQEGYEADYGGGGVGTDTIIEVAEQVFEEKIKKIGNQLEELKEFSTIAGTKLSSFEQRINKIETTIENLQIKILEKIGSYGQGIDSIKKEMSMMQESFSKTLPGLVNSATNKKPVVKKTIKKKVVKKNSKK